MEIKYISENDYELWDKFCLSSKPATFMHTSKAMKYMMNSNFEVKVSQKSFCVIEANEIFACMPMFIEEKNGKKSLSYGGEPLLTPVISDKLNDGTKKQILRNVLEEIERVSISNNIPFVKMRIAYLNSDYLEKKSKYNFLSENGFLETNETTCILDLNGNFEEIQRKFSKGHKSDVKTSQKHLELEIIDKKNCEDTDIENFMKYYFYIAGKKTRPESTFKVIQEWINDDNAMLLKSNFEGKCCGYSLIFYYKDTAYYAMACKEKELENLKISHFLQYYAIDLLKQKNIKYYEVGTQDFGDLFYKDVSEKDINISKFKRGFGGELYTVYAGEKYFNKNEFINTYTERIKLFSERNF